MSDRSARADTPEAGPVLGVSVTRRAALGAGLAVGGSLVSARSASGATKPKGTPRDIRLFRFASTADFLRGSADGTRVTDAGIVLGETTRPRTYTDPHAAAPQPRQWDSGTWTSDLLDPGFALTQAIPSWNATTPAGTWVEVLLRGRTPAGAMTGWMVLGRWCSDNPAQGGAIHRTSVDGQTSADVDVWTDTLAAVDEAGLVSVQLRIVLLRPAGSSLTPTVRHLAVVASSLPDDKKVRTSAPGPARGIVHNVPPLSQEVHVGHYPEWDNGGEAWCSPTSTAMIAQFWGSGPSAADTAWVTVPPDEQVDHAARQTYDHAYDGCGNWPFNTAYAGALGLTGFVTRLRSLSEAEVLVAAGLPLILSVSFGKNDLDGAGYGTNGHLLVLCGFTAAGDPVVNDPASHLIPDNGQVRVTYRRDQFENVWLPHSGGLAYVLRPTGTALPKAPAQANW